MKDVIIEEKAREKKRLLEGIADMTAPVEMARALSSVDLAGKYMWAMSNTNIDAAKELGLTGIKKYWKRAEQVEMELDWLHDWIPALATFMRHSHSVYDNEEVTQSMSARRDIDSE